MQHATVHDLKQFYRQKAGRTVRRIIKSRIAEFWPATAGFDLVGLGYALPYLKPFEQTAARITAIMNPESGVHPDAPNNKNRVALAESTHIPLATEATDRILMIHHLEYLEQLGAHLQECYRILKPGGRMLVIVPNRLGLWSHADWSPFGHGQPFSLSQITHYLKDKNFIIERTAEGLFIPPSKSGIILRLANMFEQIGRRIVPIVSGVHILEVSKQVYATTNTGKKQTKTTRVPLFAEPAT